MNPVIDWKSCTMRVPVGSRKTTLKLVWFSRGGDRKSAPVAVRRANVVDVHENEFSALDVSCDDVTSAQTAEGSVGAS